MPQADEAFDLSYTQNRELSWLKFNARVLEEAADKSVPLMERLRFISIFTSNLDEFFMVRVGSLFDLNLMLPESIDNKSGYTPLKQLKEIFKAVRPLIKDRDIIYQSVCCELEKHGIKNAPVNNLTGKDKKYVSNYYNDRIRPLISPQIIDHNHPFPHLKNKELYAAAVIKENGRNMLAIVGVPETVPPVLMLPDSGGVYVRTEDILLSKMENIFKIYHISEKCIISVTRNADISYDEDKFDEDCVDFPSHMTKLLRQRERLSPVRLEMQGKSTQLRTMLEEKLKLSRHQTYVCSCPLNLKYVYKLKIDDKSLYYEPYTPIFPDYLSQGMSMWEQINQRDILLFYPYHSMQPFLKLLKESAFDPGVISIQMTIYRLAHNSAVVKYLCAAAENGKAVTVIVELRARFDEKNNIEWAQELEQSGCNVIYGVENYKCHSKICLITRQEKNGRISYITQIGTGNYNENTAALYTDFSFFTADASIAEDAVDFFRNMLIGNIEASYKKLLIAPHEMKKSIISLIDDEIDKGCDGHIIFKVNSITERDIIDKLAQASQHGVKVELIVRGICCVVPGIENKTENISVISIVGRFLEHSRVYCFGDGDSRKIYISSADIMTRNQTRRVEIACPVESKEIYNWLSSYLEILLKDNVKSRFLLSSGDYINIEPAGETPFSSQQYFIDNPPEFQPTKLHHWRLINILKKITGNQ